jgi:hypothetical protein
MASSPKSRWPGPTSRISRRKTRSITRRRRHATRPPANCHRVRRRLRVPAAVQQRFWVLRATGDAAEVIDVCASQGFHGVEVHGIQDRSCARFRTAGQRHSLPLPPAGSRTKAELDGRLVPSGGWTDQGRPAVARSRAARLVSAVRCERQGGCSRRQRGDGSRDARTIVRRRVAVHVARERGETEFAHCLGRPVVRPRSRRRRGLTAVLGRSG